MQGSLRPGPREDLGKEMRSACRGHPGSQQERGQERAAPEEKAPAWEGQRASLENREKAVRAGGPRLWASSSSAWASNRV